MIRKNLPLLLMLIAGAVSCVFTFVRQYSTLRKLVSLFIVLLVFYVLGSVIKWALDLFDEENEKRQKEEGEVIEKGAEGQEDTQEDNLEDNLEDSQEDNQEETGEEEPESGMN